MDNDCISPGFLGYFSPKNHFLRFLFVGIVNTTFGYSLFALFIYCGLHYVIACLLGACCSFLFNFHMIGRFVFATMPNKNISRFLMVYGITNLLSIVLIKIGTYFLENIYLIGAMSIPFTATVSYLLNKHFVFYRMSDEAH